MFDRMDIMKMNNAKIAIEFNNKEEAEQFEKVLKTEGVGGTSVNPYNTYTIELMSCCWASKDYNESKGFKIVNYKDISEL